MRPPSLELNTQHISGFLSTTHTTLATGHILAALFQELLQAVVADILAQFVTDLPYELALTLHVLRNTSAESQTLQLMARDEIICHILHLDYIYIAIINNVTKHIMRLQLCMHVIRSWSYANPAAEAFQVCAYLQGLFFLCFCR